MPAHLIWKDDNGKNGYYLVDGYLVKSLKTKTKAHAEVLLKQYIRGKLNVEESPTVNEFYTTWIERQVPPLVRPSRARDHRQAFNRHILPRFGNVSLKDVKTSELRAYQAELLKSGLKVKTVRNILDSSFRAMYRDARGEFEVLIGRDPFLDIKWPAAKRLPPDPLTLDEKKRVLKCFLELEPLYYPFIRFQFDTGCRPSETIALTWADLNVQTRRVSINKSRHLGVDNDHPKTTHSERAITISRDLMDVIQALRHPWSQGTDKVFENKFGEPIVADHFRKDYWNRILEALDIRKRKFYATRHSFITHCVEAGYSLKEIADYCGTSVQMIEGNYCARQELDPDRLGRFSGVSTKYEASPTGFEPVLPA